MPQYWMKKPTAPLGKDVSCCHGRFHSAFVEYRKARWLRTRANRTFFALSPLTVPFFLSAAILCGNIGAAPTQRSSRAIPAQQSSQAKSQSAADTEDLVVRIPGSALTTTIKYTESLDIDPKEVFLFDSTTNGRVDDPSKATGKLQIAITDGERIPLKNADKLKNISVPIPLQASIKVTKNLDAA